MNDDRHTPAMPNLGEGEWLDPQTCKQWKDYSGLTKAEYAAIHTGQPCSGTPWLDEMIRAQRRERLAGQSLAGLLHNHKPEISNIGYVYPSDKEPYCRASVSFADALIAALEGGAK